MTKKTKELQHILVLENTSEEAEAEYVGLKRKANEPNADKTHADFEEIDAMSKFKEAHPNVPWL